MKFGQAVIINSKDLRENNLAVHNRDEVNEAREAEDQDREARLEDQHFEDNYGASYDRSKPVYALSTPSLTPKSTYDLGRTFAEMGAVGRVAMARQEIAREQAIKEHRALIPFTPNADSQLPQIEDWAQYLTTNLPSYIEKGDISIERVFNARSILVLLAMPIANGGAYPQVHCYLSPHW